MNTNILKFPSRPFETWRFPRGTRVRVMTEGSQWQHCVGTVVELIGGGKVGVIFPDHHVITCFEQSEVRRAL